MIVSNRKQNRHDASTSGERVSLIRRLTMNNSTPIPPVLQDEIWKPIPGYEGWYEVSNIGRVKRVRPTSTRKIERLLTPKLNRGGYTFVHLSKNGSKSIRTVHRLVAIAFLGDPPTPKHVTNHINAIRDDNRVGNLEWATYSQNNQQAFDMGHRPVNGQKGETHHKAKLTYKKVEEIRTLLGNGKSSRYLAALYGVSRGTIKDIKHMRTWVY